MLLFIRAERKSTSWFISVRYFSNAFRFYPHGSFRRSLGSQITIDIEPVPIQSFYPVVKKFICLTCLFDEVNVAYVYAVNFFPRLGALFLSEDSFLSSDGIHVPQLLLLARPEFQLDLYTHDAPQFFLRFYYFVTDQWSS